MSSITLLYKPNWFIVIRSDLKVQNDIQVCPSPFHKVIYTFELSRVHQSIGEQPWSIQRWSCHEWPWWRCTALCRDTSGACGSGPASSFRPCMPLLCEATKDILVIAIGSWTFERPRLGDHILEEVLPFGVLDHPNFVLSRARTINRWVGSHMLRQMGSAFKIVGFRLWVIPCTHIANIQPVVDLTKR